jgi:hypothetical protein
MTKAEKILVGEQLKRSDNTDVNTNLRMHLREVQQTGLNQVQHEESTSDVLQQ